MHPLRRLRPQAGDRRLLVHGRHRLGHRAQLHRLRPAVQRRDPGDVRGHAGHPAPRPVLGARREVPGVRSSTPRRPRSARCRSGATTSRPSSTCPRCACWARSASRSTPRPGCGTAKNIGGDRCPVVDTWWQTETGAIMISPLPGVTAAKPGSAMSPLPGITADVVDDTGTSGAERRRRLPGRPRAVAGDAAHDLGRRQALHRHVLVAVRRAATSPATARSGTRTATCGCSAGSTTSCWSPATTSPRPRWSRRWSRTRRSPSRRSSARPTRPPARPSSRS